MESAYEACTSVIKQFSVLSMFIGVNLRFVFGMVTSMSIDKRVKSKDKIDASP